MFTTTHTKAIRHWTLLTVCSILLTLALIACGGGSMTSSTSAPTPKPTAAPSPAAASDTQTYSGDGFTIDYPSDLQPNTATPGQVVFANASGTVAPDTQKTTAPNIRTYHDLDSLPRTSSPRNSPPNFIHKNSPLLGLHSQPIDSTLGA